MHAQAVLVRVRERGGMHARRMTTFPSGEIETGNAAILVRDRQVSELHRNARRQIAQRTDDQPTDDAVVALRSRESAQAALRPYHPATDRDAYSAPGE